MTPRRAALAALVAVLALAALPAGAGAANECNGIQRCIPVEGPWVAVPATGEVDYMLQCPGGKGIVAGTDGQASSTDIRASFDAILGSPIASGRSTSTAVLFRAVSASHRGGAFKPFVGCIPSQTSVRNTIATESKPVGAPLDLRAVTVKVSPGVQKTVTLGCPAGEQLVDSWSATAFGSAKPPAPGLASAIHVQSRVARGRVSLAIAASEALPQGASAQVQLGVRCAA